MAEAGAEGGEGGGSHASPKSGASPLVLIISSVNLLATLGMLGLLFTSHQKEKASPAVEDIALKEGGGGEGAAKKEGEKGGEKAAEGGEGKPASEKKPADYGKMITLEPFTVNLSTPGSVAAKFARVNVSLEVPSEDIEAEVNAKMPQVRNVIIDLFNSKRPADLASPDGRDYLKEEIRNALNSFLISGKVKGVYFTGFALSA